MKFNIIPTWIEAENIEAADKEEALVKFASTMDLDMNSYFKAVPAFDNTHQIAELITKIIRAYQFDASDLSDIFRAINAQDNVIGGKLWTTTEIERYVCEEYADKEFVVANEDWIAEIQNNLDEDAFNDTTDREWCAIRDAIKDAADECNVHVTDIKWDVDPEEFDSETEYEAVLLNVLPTEVDIPLSELEHLSIEDWLSDNNGYCVESYIISTNGNTQVTYMYRDADNYKALKTINLLGKISEEQIDAIIDSLEEGLYFIPEQIGLEKPSFDYGDAITEADHCFCELTKEDFSTVSNNSACMTVDEFVRKFVDVGSTGWDSVKYAVIS